MKNVFSIHMSTAAILAMAIFVNEAVAEPSKKETIDYILKTHQDFYTEYKQRNPSAVENRLLSFDQNGCKLTFISEIQRSDEQYIGTLTQSFFLKDLDPNEVESRNDYGDIFLKCRERKECIRTSLIQKKFGRIVNSDTNRTESHVTIVTGSPTRIGKAFKHLIRLCGGKEELF